MSFKKDIRLEDAKKIASEFQLKTRDLYKW